MLSIRRASFVIIMMLLILINIKVAWCIVNNPPDRIVQDSKTVSLTSAGIFNRFQKQNFDTTREFRKGAPQFGFWGSHLLNPYIAANPANINNLIQTSNDHVDMTGASHDVPLGSANGYVFQLPSKTKQGFKTFGIRLGKFGHLYGTGAFFSHQEFPHENQ